MIKKSIVYDKINKENLIENISYISFLTIKEIILCFFLIINQYNSIKLNFLNFIISSLNFSKSVLAGAAAGGNSSFFFPFFFPLFCWLLSPFSLLFWPFLPSALFSQIRCCWKFCSPRKNSSINAWR